MTLGSRVNPLGDSRAVGKSEELHKLWSDRVLRYSPAVCLGCKVETVSGDPNPKHISTSWWSART